MTIDHDVPIEAFMTRTTHTVSFAETLDVAEKRMSEHNIRHLPVMDGDKLTGVLSDREVKLAVAMSGFKPERLTAGEVCTPLAYSVSPETPLSDVAATMAEKRYGSCIVIDGEGRVLGIFTTTDACAALAAALER